MILSYLAKPDCYLPLFEFSEVTIGNTKVEDDFIDEHRGIWPTGQIS